MTDHPTTDLEYGAAYGSAQLAGTTPPQARAVVVYSQPRCIQCDRTKAWLTRKGVEFTEVDVTTDDDALRYIRDELGYQAVPVVVSDEPGVNDALAHWYGYRPDLLGNFFAQAVTR